MYMINMQMMAILQLMYFKEQEWMKIDDIEDTLKEKEFEVHRNNLNEVLRELILVGSLKSRITDDMLEYKVRLIKDEQRENKGNIRY